MNISIICLLYNAEEYIRGLHKNILNQDIVNKVDVKYVLTESTDNTETILKELNANYHVIKKHEFSHSLIREKEAFNAKGEIVVFITQDIIICDNKWLFYLTEDIKLGKCEAAFSRQICNDKSIERYIRMKNYPKESRTVSSKDIEKLGIMTYFFSDASSAVRKDVFVMLNGYDNKNLLTNEDMYFAYKLINNGYRIKYCPESKVIHSHNYKLKTLFKRYFDQGVFLSQHKYIKEAGDNEGAVELLKFTLWNIIKEANIKALFLLIPNFAARFIGNKLGQNYEKIDKNKLEKYSSNKEYWSNNK